METKPEIREKYQQVISSIPKGNLVYIDESGKELKPAQFVVI
ncbi:IS630 family transposase [Orientia tsutsugamushi]|nr:IS630 family transposase [Orientia tsutsugamushi]